jgi:hypothetical protein
LNLFWRIAGAAPLLATGKLAPSTGFDGAQMQRRLVARRAGSESINSLILQVVSCSAPERASWCAPIHMPQPGAPQEASG